MNPDGSGRVRVPDRDTNATFPVFCGSDAFVFANLKDNSLNLFRQNLTTGEVKQLTFERDAEWPACTRDGKTVYYVDNLDGAALKRISTSGGTPEVIAQQSAAGAALSPDETRITYFQFSVTAEHKNLIVVENVDGSNRITLSATGLALRPDWAPDGKALILDKLTGAGSNLFYQPLDGGKPTQITHIDSEPRAIAMFSLSPDGKQIAIGRSKMNDSDLVMFSNFR